MMPCCDRARPDSVVLGATQHGHAVLFWTGYGVVCPCEVTTNGSLHTLMRSWGRPVSLTNAGVAFFIGRAMAAVRKFSQTEPTP